MLSYNTVRVKEEQWKDLLREAEKERLIREIRGTRPGLLDRVLASVGGLLISVGTKLQMRYALSMPRDAEAY